MKKFDFVKIINNSKYSKNNLQKDMQGIVVDILEEKVKVLFFNSKNDKDYAVISIDKKDLSIEKENMPENFQLQLSLKLDNLITSGKDNLENIEIEEYDMVELIVEDEKYSKFGIHKGDIGCVIDDNMIDNYIVVVFSGIDENGEYYGDCISVNIKDLKILE